MPKALHEPFEDIGEQRSAEEAGIWIFLASELIFFGGLFLGYAVYRVRYPEGFAAAGAEVNLALGVANTVLLLTSSVTMAFAVGAGRKGNSQAVIWGLLATLALGAAFLGVKSFEYMEDVRHHLIPGHPDFPVETFGAEMFFSFYWGMTAVHGVHMAIGLGVISVDGLGRAPRSDRLARNGPSARPGPLLEPRRHRLDLPLSTPLSRGARMMAERTMKRLVLRLAAAYVAMLLLTASAIAAAHLLPGLTSTLVLLGISLATAAIIVLAFMDVRHTDTVSRLSATIALGFLAVMFSLTFADELTRSHISPGFEGNLPE